MIERNFERFLEKIIRVIIPIIFFIPLIVNADYYFPFITPRNFIFRILISLAFGLYFILFFKNRARYKPLLDRSFYSYVALLIILTVSSLVNGDFLYSFWGNYERMDGLLGSYYLLAMLLVILGVYKSKKSWQYLLRISVFVSFLVSFIALGQYFGADIFLPSSTGARASSILGNPIYLAAYNLFNLFFAAYLWSKSIKIKKAEILFFIFFDFVLVAMEVLARSKGLSGPLTQILSNYFMALFFVVPQLLFLANYFLSRKKESLSVMISRFYFIIIIIINFFSLFNTQTRGAIVGIVLALLPLFVFCLLSKKISQRAKIAASLLFVAVSFSVFSIFVFKEQAIVTNNHTLRRISQISLSDITTESRMLTWSLSFKAFLEKPVLGYGQENFYFVFNKYFPKEIFKDNASQIWFDRPHNIFIQYLIYGGVLGLMAYLAIFFFLFQNLYRHYKKTKDPKTLGIFGTLIVAYLFQNFFVFDSLSSNILFILLLAVSSFSYAKNNTENKEPAERKSSLLPGVVIFLLVAILAYFVNVPQMRANQDLVSGIRNIRINAFKGYDEAAYRELIRSINSNYLGKFEGRQVLSDHVTELIFSPDITYDQKIGPLNLAEAELLKSIEDQPHNVRHYVFLMNLYTSASLLNPVYASKNHIIFEKAVELSSARAPIYTNLAKSYFYSGQPNLAIDFFKKAREISPYNVDVNLDLLAAYIFNKDLEAANNLMAELEDNFENIYRFSGGRESGFSSEKQSFVERNYIKLTDVYARFSYFQEAIGILERQFEKYPQSIVLAEKLENYYSSVGDYAKAAIYKSSIEKLKKEKSFEQ